MFVVLFSVAYSVVTSASATTCGYTPIKPTFSGKTMENAKPYSWPWTAFFCDTRYRPAALFCDENYQGAVVGKRWILSTTPPDDIVESYRAKVAVFNANNDSEAGMQLYQVKKFHFHPKSRHSYIYDISLYELHDEIQFNDRVQPICLPLDDSDLRKRNFTAWITGWRRELHSFHTYSFLQQTNMSILNFSKEPLSFYSFDQRDVQLIAGAQLVRKLNKWFHYGVLIYDFSPGMNDAVFTRTALLCDWISKTTSTEVRCTSP
ncbi:chymotrypsin-C [Aphelenchoides avenae]|nr:chymotrypsin-C [Aphelenchus avenae]